MILSLCLTDQRGIAQIHIHRPSESDFTAEWNGIGIGGIIIFNSIIIGMFILLDYCLCLPLVCLYILILFYAVLCYV